MSILLIGLADEIAAELVTRLVGQGDEVRVLEADRSREDRWRGFGAYVAAGSMDDPDLIERAATNVRTLVLGPHLTPPAGATVTEILRGAEAAGVGRIVVAAPEPDPEVVSAVVSAPTDHVVLTTGKRRILRRGSRVPPSLQAEAIDAADDLAGEPSLDLDLTDPRSWTALRLGWSERDLTDQLGD